MAKWYLFHRYVRITYNTYAYRIKQYKDGKYEKRTGRHGNNFSEKA